MSQKGTVIWRVSGVKSKTQASCTYVAPAVIWSLLSDSAFVLGSVHFFADLVLLACQPLWWQKVVPACIS